MGFNEGVCIIHSLKICVENVLQLVKVVLLMSSEEKENSPDLFNSSVWHYLATVVVHEVI